MVEVVMELPNGFEALNDFPKLRTSLTNLMRTESGLLRTPALEPFATGTGICRGAHNFNGILYHVSGTKLLQVSSSGTVFEKGTISGGDPVAIDISFKDMMLVVKNGLSYVWDDTTLTQITDSNFPTSVDVAYADGFFLVVPADGGPVQFSDINNPLVWPVLNFIDAELLPDKNVGIHNFKNYVFVFGEESIETLRSTGDSGAPFVRVDNQGINVGLVGGKIEYSNTLAFIGREKESSFGVHILGSGNAPKISSPAIDEILNDEYTLAELQDAQSSQITWKGESMLVITLARHTLAYNGTGWFFMDSTIDGIHQHSPWRANFPVFAYGRYYVGDRTNTRIGELTDGNEEYNKNIEREWRTFIRTQRGKYFRLNSLELDVLSGVDVPFGDDPQIELRLSQDGRTYFDPFSRPLGKTAQYSQRVKFQAPGGLGLYESFAGIILRTTAPVDFAAEGAFADAQ